LQEQEELNRISSSAVEALKEIEKTPADIVSNIATEQRNIISQANSELIEVNKEIHISSEVNKIIQDLDSKKLIAPDYFANNIIWVLNGQITNQAFLSSYNYLLHQGTIHAPTVEPPIVTPPPEQKNIYWIVKSAPPDRSGKQIEISVSDKTQLEGQGWVFSLTEPTPAPIIITPPPEPTPEPTPEPIPEPTPEPIEVLPPVFAEPDSSITDNMVTQQLINFNIVNGRAVGSIKFVATNNFNPFWYGKNIVNIIQFKDPNGANILTYVKENRLNFTETERDEVISYDEDMKGNTRATVESFVWSSAIAPTPFSKMYSIEISEAEPPKPLTTGFMGAGIAGAIAGLVLIGFIADHKRGK